MRPLSLFTFTELKQMLLFTKQLGFPTLGHYLIDRLLETGETPQEALIELNHSSIDLYIDQIS